MPDVDISDVTMDVAVAGELFVIVSRPETVNGFGESVPGDQRREGWGSVTSVSPADLIRNEAFDAAEKTILVVTTAHLRSSSYSSAGIKFKPDLVQWRGDYYLVREVEDFSRYGVGTVEAKCALFSYEPRVDQEEAP